MTSYLWYKNVLYYIFRSKFTLFCGAVHTQIQPLKQLLPSGLFRTEIHNYIFLTNAQK